LKPFFGSALAANLIDYPHLLGNRLGYDRLQPIHGEWIRKVFGVRGDQNLQAHRGSYKTTALTIVGLIWWLIFNPEDRILLSRKNFKASCNTIEEIGDNFRKPVIREVFEKVWGIENFKLRTNRKDRIVLPTKTRASKEGNIDAAGVDTSVTGLHYERLWNDDVITIEDKTSPAEREDTIRYLEEQKNLRNPGGAINMVGTPWHKLDAWSTTGDPLKYPLGDPRVNIPGFTKEYIDELKRGLTAATFASQYLLELIAEEDRIFPDPIYGDWPEALEPIAFLDPAFGGANCTALAMGGEYRGQLYARGWVWPMDVTTLYTKIVTLLERYKNGTLHVETNADKGACARDLSKLYPAIEEVNETTNKHVRIVAYARQHFLKLLFAKDTQPEFINQIVDYEEKKEPDDAPDALAGLIRAIGVGEPNIEDRYPE